MRTATNERTRDVYGKRGRDTEKEKEREVSF